MQSGRLSSHRRPLAFAALTLSLLASGCIGLARDDQGALQPQAVRGPCDVQKFFFLSQRAVPTRMTIHNTGEACTFTVINTALQATPTATLITVPAAHGQADTGLISGARQVSVSYRPHPGYAGTDRFTVTIEPDAHGIAVAVTVQP